MGKDNPPGRSERSAQRRLAKPPDLRDALRGSISPAPTSELASNLRSAAGSSSGPSRAAAAAEAAAVLFRAPTPAPADEDTVMESDDADTTVKLPVFVPPPTDTPDRNAILANVEKEAFTEDIADDPDVFYASGAKDKVLADLAAATSSTHNLVELLNLYSTSGYRLDPEATDKLTIELLQAVSTAAELGLVQHALAAGSSSQYSAIQSLIESLRSQAPPAPAPIPPTRNPGQPPPLPRSTNAIADPAGLNRPAKKAILFARSRKRPTPPNPNTRSFANAAAAASDLPQPPPLKKRKGPAATQAGLVQMAKSFPTATTEAIVQAQQVVSGSANATPSATDRARSRVKRSTTHGPSRKEVIVFTSPPVAWPDTPVVGAVNSFLGTQKLSLRIVSETRNHLGGLALLCDERPTENDIQALHAFFHAKAKKAWGFDAETRVEVGSSKSFMRIPNFPYFGVGNWNIDAKGKPIPITPAEVKDVILTSKWKDAIFLYQGTMPR